MLGVQYHAQGNTRKVRDMIRRAGMAEIERHCIGPFEHFVLHQRIPIMYSQGGRVTSASADAPDGQPAWPALSKWTIASKGVSIYTGVASTGGRSLTPLVTNAMKMCQAYMITYVKSSATVFRFELTNTARSSSKWSPGYDYPSALHTGWGPYEVKPKATGPGFLAWPIQKGTVISGSMGRKDTGTTLTKYGIAKRKGKAKALTVASSLAFAFTTHPSGAPARPHIKFFAIDSIMLGRKVLDYVFRGSVA
jgi:hypothetical protein